MSDLVKLGPLVETALNKEYPECWKVFAEMTQCEYEYDKESDEFFIFVGNEEVSIHRDDSFSTTASLSKQLITEMLVHVIKQTRANKENK